MATPATFVPFVTYADTAFWNELNKRKLNDWMLDESYRRIDGTFSIYDDTGSDCRLSLGHESFVDSSSGGDVISRERESYEGQIVTYNTLEAFRNLDRAAVIKSEADKLWVLIKSGEWISKPRSLFTFLFTVFADLKKFQYYYWNCVPTLCFPSNIRSKQAPLDLTEDIVARIRQYYKSTAEHAFVLAKDHEVLPFSALQTSVLEEDQSAISIVFVDSSPVDNVPGWSLRNLLAAIAVLKQQWTSVRIISLKGMGSLTVHQFEWDACTVDSETPTPASVGWERNPSGKLQPHHVDLRNQFDPVKLMEQSVGLNLSLIKWRQVPDLRLERFTQLKVLIFGAGTLGCNIARGLMGWGVNSITFVDNSIVSYNNPVRQSLSEFEDARLGKGKAETAANALRRIYPSVDAKAYKLTVPMPGHAVSPNQEEALAAEVALLEQLVASHDVIYLALDSREARWLPTLMANRYGKMAITVAVGFDTYVVIRHGVNPLSDDTGVASIPAPQIAPATGTLPYSQLSCYFCSDVTAPGNSTNDRTLDQQCTVSRAGVSMMVSGAAVELLASILQHPEPLKAPANMGDADELESSSLLGAIPHQLRGFVFRFKTITVCVGRFSQCIACGSAVAEAYKEQGWRFVKEVMNSPLYLERVTGLDQLQMSTNDVDIDLNEDSDSIMSHDGMD